MRPGALKRGTSCFVHGLFHDSRLRGNISPPPEVEKLSPTCDKDHDDQRSIADVEQHLASRLLTKKQLSDMAFSIRELSKRLGQYKLRLKVHNVFLLTKAHDPTLIRYTRQVAEWLLSKDSGGQHTVFVEDTLRSAKAFGAEELVAKHESYKDRLRYWNNDLCQKEPHTFDIIIAVSLLFPGYKPRR